MSVQMMTPTQAEKDGWSRLAQNAYATDRNDFGHCFSSAASLQNDGQISLHMFDALQATYRAWLVYGEWKAVVR